MTAALARLDRARHLDRAAEQQQLFRERGLCPSGWDDGERAPLGPRRAAVRAEKMVSVMTRIGVQRKTACEAADGWNRGARISKIR